MKNILVPTDFTPASISALKLAIHIAKRNPKVSIRMSHVYKVPRLPSLPSDDYGYDVRKQKKMLTEIHDNFSEIARMDMMKGIKIETQVIPHKKVYDILNHKDNRSVDLIICGVHGNKDWHRTIEGTHMETIIRNAECPVICVHEKIKGPLRFNDVVFASDFSSESYKAFPKLKKLFDILGCRLHLVKIVTPQHFENTIQVEKEMKEFAEKEFLTNYTIKVFNDENVELGIHRYAYSINANLIAMETHGHTGFIHYLKGSILESVAHHSELPVMSMKMEERN